MQADNFSSDKSEAKKNVEKAIADLNAAIESISGRLFPAWSTETMNELDAAMIFKVEIVDKHRNIVASASGVHVLPGVMADPVELKEQTEEAVTADILRPLSAAVVRKAKDLS